MRRMIMSSLVLLPVMAHAQASTSTEPQPSTSSAMLHAELTRPATPAEMALAAASPAAAGSVAIMPVNAGSHAAIREFVRTQMVDDLSVAAMREPGTLEFALKGSVSTEATAPRLTRAVEVDLSEHELAEQPAVSTVVIHAIVDMNGVRGTCK